MSIFKDHIPLTHKTNEIKINEDIICNIEIGGIAEQQTIEKGEDVTSFLKKLLTKTFYPTLIAPSSTITLNKTNEREAGELYDTLLTHNFNRGSILGKTVNSIWEPNTLQGYRAGEAINYTISGQDRGTDNTLSKTNSYIPEGANVIQSLVTYNSGVQPIDSNGNNYDSPLPEGTSETSITVYGRRKLFYGVDNDALDSADIRSLSETYLNPTESLTFDIEIPVGAVNVVFAYPDYLRAVNSVVYVEGLNAEIKDVFNLDVFPVNGANEILPRDYKVYKYTPVEPYSSTTTYRVTI